MVKQTITNRTLRFSYANSAFLFEKCANEHLFDTEQCPNPGVAAETLKDYVTANNYTVTIVPSSDGGITGGEEENGTTLRLLALNEIDFTGFGWTYCISSNNSSTNYLSLHRSRSPAVYALRSNFTV